MRAGRGGGRSGRQGLAQGEGPGARLWQTDPCSHVRPRYPRASRPRPHGPRTAGVELRAPREPSSALVRAPGPGPQEHPTRMRTPARISNACALLLTCTHVHTCTCAGTRCHRGAHTCACTHKAHVCMRVHTCSCSHSHMHTKARTRRGFALHRAVPMEGGWGGAAGLLPGGGGSWRPAPLSSSASPPGAPCGPGGGPRSESLRCPGWGLRPVAQWVGWGWAQRCGRPNGLPSWPAASAAATCTSPSSTTPRSAWRCTPCSSSTLPPGSCCSPLSPSSSSSPSRPSSSSLSGRVGGHVPGALKPSPTPSCSPGQPVALSVGETARTPQQMGPDVGSQDAQRGAGAMHPPPPGHSRPPLLRGQ